MTVLCGLPNYEKGTIRDEYRHGRNRIETHNGVSIVRCYEHPRRKNLIDRFFNYWSFAWSGKKKIKKLSNNFDVVFINGLSPVMQCEPGIAYARLYQKKTLLYCLDIWPESLAAGGIRAKGITKPVYLRYLSISSSLYRLCDRILVTSMGFKDYLSHRCGVDPLRVDYLPQYSESLFQKNVASCQTKKEFIRFVFAGNVGKAQDLPTLLRAAKLLKDPRIQIVIVGDGSALKDAKKKAIASSLKNVIFLGRLPLEKMPEIYAEADAMIVILSNDDFAQLVVPGKFQTYLASGKPVIASCGRSLKAIINDAMCGFSCDSGDASGLADIFQAMARLDNAERKRMGENGRVYASVHFDRDVFFNKLEKELLSLI